MLSRFCVVKLKRGFGCSIWWSTRWGSQLSSSRLGRSLDLCTKMKISKSWGRFNDAWGNFIADPQRKSKAQHRVTTFGRSCRSSQSPAEPSKRPSQRPLRTPRRGKFPSESLAEGCASRCSKEMHCPCLEKTLLKQHYLRHTTKEITQNRQVSLNHSEWSLGCDSISRVMVLEWERIHPGTCPWTSYAKDCETRLECRNLDLHIGTDGITFLGSFLSRVCLGNSWAHDYLHRRVFL